MTIEKVLVVDDEALICRFLAETFRRNNIEAICVDTGEKAIELLNETAFDMVVTDMKLPGKSGIDVLKKAKDVSPSTIVIVITGFGSIENAVEAMRFGAFNYLIKPFSAETIEAILEKIKEHTALVNENQYWRQQAEGIRVSKKIISESPCMKQILEDVMRIAKSNASVFINGESGTGKEVIAHAIHYNSPRAQHPFIKVNCAAIPETLIEAEFFGHEKGAFTGATARRLGRFELANGGSLLLDEITEIPLSLQAKLLRVTQEQEFERIGGARPIKVDVRLISTSNRDIKEVIQQKILRQDLFYRLNVIPIYLPPLRERKEDIIPLAEYFLERICIENHKKKKSFTDDAKKKLLIYEWPGNVRELANVIERAVVLDTGLKIAPEHLYLDNFISDVLTQPMLPLEELERRLIIETLQAQQNDPLKTAKILGVSPSILKDKMSEYQL